MGSYDKSFAIIAKMRGHVGPEDLSAAESSLERRLYADEPATIKDLLLEAGKIDAAKAQEIEAAMRRHALECTTCAASTYLLPKQNEKEVLCEVCGGATVRPKPPAARAASGRVARPSAPAVAAAVIEAPAPSASAVAEAPPPEAPPPPAEPPPVPATPPVAPARTTASGRLERPARPQAPTAATVPAPTFMPPPDVGVPVAVALSGGPPSPLERIKAVPRLVWFGCAFLALLVAYRSVSASMKLSGLESAIGSEIAVIDRMGSDVRAKSLEILKRGGLEVKPEEIQLVLYQNMKKDTRLYGVVTVRSPQAGIHLQVMTKLNSREALEIGMANGFAWIEGDRSKMWPDGSSTGRHLALLAGIAAALGFFGLGYKLSD